MRWTPENPTEVGPVPVEEEVVASPALEREREFSHIAKLTLLWNERRFLTTIGLYGAVVSAILSLIIPVRYEASARLMPPDSGAGNLAILSALTDKAGALGGMAGDLLGVKSTSDLLVGVLSSNTVQDRIIAKYNLAKVYGLTYQEDLRKRLMNNTDIGVERKSGILTVTVTDHDKTRAAAMANSYVDELNTLTAELSTSSARREREFLEDRLKQVSQDLEEAEKELGQFSSKNATLDPRDQGKAMLEAMAELQGRLIAAHAELEGVRTIYTDNSTKVRTLKAEIGRLQHDIVEMGGKPGTPAGADAGDQLYPSIRQLPVLGVTWADLYRRAKVQEAVFETLTKQYELARVQEAKDIPSIKVLDRAGVPQRKSWPPRTVLTLVGGVFGVMFGVVWILGNARWQAVDPDSPAKILAIQVWNTLTAPIKRRLRNPKWKRVVGVVLRRPKEPAEANEEKQHFS